MAGGTITTHVSHTVTLGTPNYHSPLTVTAAGYVAPTAYGADGLYAELGSATGARLINYGKIVGADGGHGSNGNGGAGVWLEGKFLEVDTSGTIRGGNGGGASGGTDAGGAGVSLQGATVGVVNSGVITGGDGYYGFRSAFASGAGGAGVSLSGGIVSLHNSGTITGGDGGYPDGAGGVGVNLAGDMALVNRGSITGGGGGYRGYGGTGLIASGAGTLSNFGSIAGGKGDYGIDSGGNGGVGLSLSGIAIFINHGSIAGGRGGENGYPGPGTVGGTGGTAVSLFAGTLVNDGVISGGAGGFGDYSGNGGAGVLLDYGTLTNTGTIAAGYSSDAVHCVFSGSILNTGLIIGGAANYAETNTYAAGDGVFCQGSLALTNSGVIQGGAYGGTGVYFDGGTVTNTGTIAGGSSYYHGGAGVFLGGGTLTNAGTIAGGAYNGGSADAVQFGSLAGTLIVDPGAVFIGNVAANAAVNDVLDLAGSSAASLTGLGSQFTGFSTLIETAGANWTLAGTGRFGGTASIGGKLTIGSGMLLAAPGTSGTVALSASGTAASVSNAGVILGGVGAAALDGGAGGAAVSLGGGASLVNAGIVFGGAGGAGSQTGGNGGAGVYLDGGTLTNAGTIAGGAGGAGLAGNGHAGDAVLFGSLAGTLIVDPGAVFIGGVVAHAAAHDVLELAGTTAGTLTGLGSQFTGFSTVALESGAIWTIDSTIATVQAIAFHGVTAQDTLELTGGGALAVADIGFGTLRLDGANAFTLSAGSTITASVAVGSGATLDGAGTLAGNVSDQGTIIASGGTLSFLGAVSNNGTIDAASGLVSVARMVTGTGTLDIGAAAALSLHGAANGQAIDFLAASGLLDLNAPLSLHGTIAGFGGGDRIDLLDTTATAAKFANGILTVRDGSAVVARLHLSGNYTSGDFQLAGDGSHGTVITFA